MIFNTPTQNHCTILYGKDVCKDTQWSGRTKLDLVFYVHMQNNYIGDTSLCQNLVLKHNLVYKLFLFEANSRTLDAFG